PLNEDKQDAYKADFVEKFGGSIVNAVSVDRLPARLPGYSDEDIVLLANNDTLMTIYSITRKEVLLTSMHPTCLNRAALSPDKKTIVAIGDSPYVHLYRVEAPPSRNVTIINALDGPFYHTWNFKMFASIVLDLDPGIRGGDTCLFAAAFNHSSNLLALGSQDGAVNVLDLPALCAKYEYDNDPAIPVKAQDQMIHTFKSSREPLQGGAVRHLEFSPAPFDLLVWIEDIDHFGVADVRTTFRRRQIVKLDPEAADLQKLQPFEIGLTVNSRRGRSWQDPHDEASGIGESGEDKDDDDSDDSDDDDFDDNDSQGGNCICQAEPGTDSHFSDVFNDEVAMAFPASRVWRDLSTEPDMRRRRAMFYERSTPEDVAEWGIEHWRSGTNLSIYLARESHYQQYWRNLRCYRGAYQVFWTTISQRDRTLQLAGSGLEMAARSILLSQMANRPPPMRFYADLRRSGDLCRHGFSAAGTQALRNWHIDQAERQRIARRAIVTTADVEQPRVDALLAALESIRLPHPRASNTSRTTVHPNRPDAPTVLDEPIPRSTSSRVDQREVPPSEDVRRHTAGQYGVDASVLTRIPPEEVAELHWIRLREQIRLVVERLIRNQNSSTPDLSEQTRLHTRLSVLHILERMWRRRGHGGGTDWGGPYGTMAMDEDLLEPLPRSWSVEPVSDAAALTTGSLPTPPWSPDLDPSSIPPRRPQEELPTRPLTQRTHAAQILSQAISSHVGTAPEPPPVPNHAAARNDISVAEPSATQNHRAASHRVTIAQPPTTATLTVNGDNPPPFTPPPRPIPNGNGTPRRSSLRISNEDSHETMVIRPPVNGTAANGDTVTVNGTPEDHSPVIVTGSNISIAGRIMNTINDGINGRLNSTTVNGTNVNGAHGRPNGTNVNGVNGRPNGVAVNGTNTRANGTAVNGNNGRPNGTNVNGVIGRPNGVAVNGTNTRANGTAVNSINGRPNTNAVNGTDGRANGTAINGIAGRANGTAVNEINGRPNGTAVNSTNERANGRAVNDVNGRANGTAINGPGRATGTAVNRNNIRPSGIDHDFDEMLGSIRSPPMAHRNPEFGHGPFARENLTGQTTVPVTPPSRSDSESDEYVHVQHPPSAVRRTRDGRLIPTESSVERVPVGRSHVRNRQARDGSMMFSDDSRQLSGAGWMSDGTLYVSIDVGLFEFPVNEDDRNTFPKYSVR
ncbi:hypothetical protein KEM56_007330, partial [Ascosphaera pollenicola]